MKIGMIGLGKMGGNMVARLLQGNQDVVAYDLSEDNIKLAEGRGAGLGLADEAPVLRRPRTVGRVALGVAIVPLAHPQEVGGEVQRLAGVGLGHFERPAVGVTRPTRVRDSVLVTDVTREVVLADDLTHVLQELGAGRDRTSRPLFHACYEGG